MEYHKIVDYKKLDPVKQAALKMFSETLKKPERLGIRVVPETIGEPAVALDFFGSNFLLAFNVEGLGTKNLIADAMAADKRGKGAEYYEAIGQDTIAMSTNDLLAIGADAIAYGDIISSGNSGWFDDGQRTAALLSGFQKAGNEIGMAIPCGETPTLEGVVAPGTVELAGASVGVVMPKEQLILGDSIQEGDIIFGLESSGVHANGISLIRKSVEKLPDGYFSELPSGKTVGEELLQPTTLYTRPVIETLKESEVHYLSPITGHGWKKIMRAKKPFFYEIDFVPEKPELLSFVQEIAGVNNTEAYYTWNMGIGYVVIAPPETHETLLKNCGKKGIAVHELGRVKKGKKQVFIKPLDIRFVD